MHLDLLVISPLTLPRVQSKTGLSPGHCQINISQDTRIEERAMQAKRKERAASREVLAGQIEEKKAMQEEARAEYLKEREQVDAVARAIQEEDEAERLRKAQKVKDTKAWVAKFLELREDLREQERRRLLEEEAQIARFAAEIERRQKATEGMREAQQESEVRRADLMAIETAGVNEASARVAAGGASRTRRRWRA